MQPILLGELNLNGGVDSTKETSMVFLYGFHETLQVLYSHPLIAPTSTPWN
jgi:hypothetical protein